jgi:hypothetical protein
MLSFSFMKRFCSSRLRKRIPPLRSQRDQLLLGWYEEEGLKLNSVDLLPIFSQCHPPSTVQNTNWGSPTLHPTSVVSSFEKGVRPLDAAFSDRNWL